MGLSAQKVRFFRDTGYLKILNAASDADLTAMTAIMDDDFKNQVEPLRTGPDGEVVKLYNTVSRDPIFLDVVKAAPIADALTAILGPNVEMKLNRHNHATINPPGFNVFRLHRDVLQWSRGLVTLILYLEDATVENGCTHVLPSSHYLPSVGAPEFGVTCMDEHDEYKDLMDQAVPVPMKAGSALLFDGCVFHTVGKNKTNATRKSICWAFHSANELTSSPNDTDSRLIIGSRKYLGNDHVPKDAYLKKPLVESSTA